MNVKKTRGFKLKNTARRTASLLLAAIMILGILPASAPKAQAESWVDPYLNKLAEWGVMKGDQNGNMNPDRNITRAEFVAMINRAYGYKTVASTPFTDVYLRNWYYDDIGIAYGAGYFNGTSATTASPERTLTREEAAVVMARNMRLQPVVGEATSFNDGRYFSSWSRGLIESAARHNVISGYPDGSFQPFRNITRGEMAALVARAVGTLIKDPGVHALGSVGGNVTITTSGVTLRDTVIAGDLYLTGGVGLGSVTLDNVTVLGKIVISGAGEANAGDSSVIIRNTRAEQMVVDSIVNQFVTIRAEGDTLINKTSVRTQAYIEDVSPSNRGLPNIEVDGERGLKVQLAGNIKDVINLTPDSTLTLAQGRANVVTIDEEATGSTLHIELGSTINTLNLDVGTTVTGKGDVGHLNVNAAGCTVEMLPDTITIRPGITANIYGEVMDSAAAIESSSSPRILAGYPAVRDVAPNSASAVFSTNKKGTLYWAISSISDGSVSEDDLINPPVYGGNIIQSGHMEMPSSNTEVPIPLTNLITDGSYYVSAVLVDNRDKRSPVKVAAFTTPDNTVPAFSVNPTVSVNKENDAWATVLPSKSCQLYYAVLPQGAVAPTIDEFKTGSVSGNLGYGVRSVIKNVTDTFQVNTADLDELKDYVLYLLLIDADGAMNSGVTSVPFRTLDITPPQFVIEAQATGIRERAVDVNTTINENGTIFWVVVNSGQNYPVALPGQNEVPSLTSESAKMQVENAMGNVRASGRVTATANRDTRITISQNLEPATAYDLYYVAKDTAGNYSYEVKKLTINTLDNVPPTVSQRFTSTVDEAGTQPLSTSDIEIIFSESVMDSSPNTGDSFIQLQEKINNSSLATEVRNEARNTLTNLLRNDIRLIDDSTAQKDRVQEKTKENEATIGGAWIDYRNVKVSMRDGQTVITFKSGTDINLASGGSYHFEIRNICDVSNNRNDMTPNPTHLASFTVAFAQVTLTEGVSSTPIEPDPDDSSKTKNVRVDMSFTMTPLSTNTVADGVHYDMFIWTDTTVAYDLYVRVLKPDKRTPVFPDEPDQDVLKALSMFGSNDQIFNASHVDANGWIKLGNSGPIIAENSSKMAVSVNRLINGYDTDTFSKLNTLNEKYTYEFAISMTKIGTSTDYSTWSENVTLWINVAAGDQSMVRNLATSVGNTGAEQAWKNFLNRGISSIGFTTAGVDDFFVWRQFTDVAVPVFSTEYPEFVAGDQLISMNLLLDRAGTVYYIVAPVDGLSEDGSGTPRYTITTELADTYQFVDIPAGGDTSANLDKSQKVLKTPTSDWVYDYVTRLRPGDQSASRIKSGTVSVNAAATTETVRGLEPKHDYLIYLVVRGTSQKLSNVHCFHVKTTTVRTPTIVLNANATTANLRTSTDAEGVWITVAYNSSRSGPVNLQDEFSTYVDSSKATEYNTALTVYNEGKILTIVEAMIKTIGTGQSFFDAYANTYMKQEMLNYVTGDTGADVITGKGNVESKENTQQSVDCSKKLDGTELSDDYYYMILAMKNKLGEEYAFRAFYPVYKADTEPPYIVSLSAQASQAFDSNGEVLNWQHGKPHIDDYRSYTYSGNVTILFNEEIRLLPTDGTDKNLVTLTGDPGGNIGNYILATDVTLSDFKVKSDSIQFKFSGARQNSSIVLFRGGLISDTSSNTIGEGTRMVLTFKNQLNNTGVEVLAYFESNIPVGKN